MGLREDAYLRYLSGSGKTLTAANVPQEMIPYLQGLAGRAYDKPTTTRGQLLYEDYPTDLSNGYGELKATIGRTGIGQITRDGNNWRIRDRYDFNPVDGGLTGDLSMAWNAIKQGDKTTALGRLTHASNVGKPFDVDISVPLSAEQLKQFGDRAKDINTGAVWDKGFKLGGQDYEWQQVDTNPTDSMTALAKQYMGGGTYKAEGTNLEKMQKMLAMRNGNFKAGEKTWVPVAKPNQNALDLVNSYVGAIQKNLGKFLQ